LQKNSFKEAQPWNQIAKFLIRQKQIWMFFAGKESFSREINYLLNQYNSASK